MHRQRRINHTLQVRNDVLARSNCWWHLLFALMRTNRDRDWGIIYVMFCRASNTHIRTHNKYICTYVYMIETNINCPIVRSLHCLSLEASKCLICCCNRISTLGHFLANESHCHVFFSERESLYNV